MILFYILFSAQVSEKQRSLLIAERAKPQNIKKSWIDVSKLLNAEGPCIKTSEQWREVRKQQNMC